MAEDQTPGGFPQLASWSRPDRPYPGGGAAYGTMIEALRDFLDHLAGSKPDEATIAALGEDLKAWSERLAPLGVRETEQIWGRRHDLPGRGQALWPPLTDIDSDESSVSATVYFGRRYLGGNGAVHGGALPLLFDEVLGQLSNIGGRSRARTAYLHVNYRSITPIEKPLRIRAWFVSESGRKRLVHGELKDGEVLCADAQGLFVQLKPGQP